jgi:hypothetical protein
MLHVNGKPRATLTSDELRHFVRVGSVDMTIISEEEIETIQRHRSSSAGLVRHPARRLSRPGPPHNITEIDTLAVATLTCVAYGMWWKKPKDMGCPYIVHWKAQHRPS